MNILCADGRPAGRCFAISMKLRNSSHAATVARGNRADDSFGLDVILSGDARERMRKDNPGTTEAIRA